MMFVYYSPDYEKQRLRRLAIHEAGHAVVSRRMGWEATPVVERENGELTGYCLIDRVRSTPLKWRVWVGMAGLLAERMLERPYRDAEAGYRWLTRKATAWTSDADRELMGSDFTIEDVEIVQSILREEWGSVLIQAEVLIDGAADLTRPQPTPK